MAWNIRTSAPAQGTSPYNWSDPNKFQCTWYSYYRVQEGSGLNQPPCWFDKASGTPGYTNAKEWLNEYRDPWQVKDVNYIPVPGDIAVFTGTYGHCMVIESKIDNDHYMISDYNMIAPDTFDYAQWTRGSRRQGYISTGNLIGYLHNPNIQPGPGPTPSPDLEISITPSSYDVTMDKNEEYKDFTFNIVVTGIPDGETISGGNTYPGLSRVYNTGWSYTDYEYEGETYRQASKTQTLRYVRESKRKYEITKHMYYDLEKSTGEIHTDTQIKILVEAQGTVMFLNPEIGSIDIR